jgi:hypothetical protein
METTREFQYGDAVKVKGLHGEFAVHHKNPDGSYCIYGGTFSHRQFRDIYPDRLTPIKRKERP